MTTLPRTFCPDCQNPLLDRQRIHGMYHEHWDCYEARLRGEFPSHIYPNGANGGPLNDAKFDPDWRPEPDRLVGVTNGWLAPDGRFYKCTRSVHVALGTAMARYFIDDNATDDELERLGWGHVSDIGFHQRGEGQKPTQAQLDALWDWYTTIRDATNKEDGAWQAKHQLEFALKLGAWAER